MFKPISRNSNYMVNELGQVFSVRKNKILTPKYNHDGYLRIQLWKKNNCEFVSIHRLVAEVFVPKPENKPFVNHIDGNKQNNHFTNLEWCTQQENIIHAFKMGLSKREHNGASKSKVIDQLNLNHEVIKTWPSQMEIQRTLGINHSHISYACKHYPNSTAKGYRWRFHKEESA